MLIFFIGNGFPQHDSYSLCSTDDSFVANCLCTDFSLLQSVRTGSGVQPVSYSMGTEVKWPSREADVSPLNLVASSRAQGLCLLYFFEYLTPSQCYMPFSSIVIPLDYFYALEG
jgi:hypothetical protein